MMIASQSHQQQQQQRELVIHSSAPSLDALPDLIIVKILIRLRCCRSCFQCKCVSKRWFSLISQPYFISQFITLCNKSLAPPSPRNELSFTLVSSFGKILLTRPAFESSGFSLSFLPCFQPGEGTRSVFVVGSSSDLLLCCSTEFSHKDYYVCNPLTKQWIQLPQPPRTKRFAAVGFISDPLYSFDNEGRVVVDLKGECGFKVVRGPEFRTPLESSPMLEIFSSDTWEWSEVDVMPPPPPGFSFDAFCSPTLAFANCGILHWWWTNYERITAYDPLRNSFRLIEKPEGVHPYGGMGAIGSCKGRIRVSQLLTYPLAYNNDAPAIKIWELEDSDSGKWQLVRQVHLQDLVCEDPWLDEQVSSANPALENIFIHPDDPELVFLLFNRCIVLCNICSLTLTSLGMIPLMNDSFWKSSKCPFRLQYWPSALSRSG